LKNFGWIDSFKKEAQKSHHSEPFHGYEFLPHPVVIQEKDKASICPFLDHVHTRADIILGFQTNKNQNNDVNHFGFCLDNNGFSGLLVNPKPSTSPT